MEFVFTKMCANGNDFVVIDNRNLMIDLTPEQVKNICQRKLGIGADGMLIIEKSKIADFKMRVINSDGTEAEMCGNGARCAAKFAFDKKISNNLMRFETLAGIIDAEIQKHRVKVKLTDPINLVLNKRVKLPDKEIIVHYLNTGVPHIVVIVEDVEKIDVINFGRHLRWHEAFAPAGTNVNFIQLVDNQTIKIRTYERGVEDETLACGTCSSASACIASLLGLVGSPVKILTKGGEILEINFDKRGSIITNLYLTGNVQVVFEGRSTING